MTLVIGGTLLVLATLGAAAAAVYHAGSVDIRLAERGNRVQLSLPAAVLRAAVAVAPASAFDDSTAEIRPLLPALDAGWQALEAAPDFVIVEASSADGGVRIEKSGSRLEIAVDAPDLQLHVGVPLDTVGQLLHKLEQRG